MNKSKEAIWPIFWNRSEASGAEIVKYEKTITNGTRVWFIQFQYTAECLGKATILTEEESVFFKEVVNLFLYK